MKPSTVKALRLLRENESATTHDFLVAGVGSRFARIHELRRLGYTITEEKLSDRSGSRYRLLGAGGVEGQCDTQLPQGPDPGPDAHACRNLSVVPESRRTARSPETGVGNRHELAADAPGRQTHPDEQLGLFAAPVKPASHYDLEAA